jgi:hypothetical protein
LLLDCEGSSAGAIPTGLKETSHYTDESNDVVETRRPFVNIAYPRLLYLFSDVFCFVFAGSAKELETILGDVVEYGKMVASGTVNQSNLPALVLVFNKVTEREGIWDVTEASKPFNTLPEIQGIYSSVQVVDILLHYFYK